MFKKYKHYQIVVLKTWLETYTMSNEPTKVKTGILVALFCSFYDLSCFIVMWFNTFIIIEDNFLLSSENLRSSPELWPEKIEGSDNFTKNSSKMGTEIDCSSQLSQNDIRMIYRKY